MNKFLALATAGAIAVVASLSITAQSEAFFPKYGFGAGVAGFIVGAAVASAAENRYDRGGYYGYGHEGWDDHVAACYGAYRTYSAHDNRYTTAFDSYGNPIRVICEL